MALDIKKAIRVDKYYPPSYFRGLTGPKNHYIFLCLKCPNEIKTTKPYAKKHSGLCIKCSNKISQPKAIKKIKLRHYEQLYNRLVDRARLFGPNFITYEQFIEYFVSQNNCHYCDSQVYWNKKSTYNLDRCDNEVGYIMNNIVVCCGFCNETKGDRFTYQEFMLLAPILKQIKLSR